jgi:hypothetical protein
VAATCRFGVTSGRSRELSPMRGTHRGISYAADSMLQPFPSFLDVSRSFAGRMRDDRVQRFEANAGRGRRTRARVGRPGPSVSGGGGPPRDGIGDRPFRNRSSCPISLRNRSSVSQPRLVCRWISVLCKMGWVGRPAGMADPWTTRAPAGDKRGQRAHCVLHRPGTRTLAVEPEVPTPMNVR